MARNKEKQSEVMRHRAQERKNIVAKEEEERQALEVYAEDLTPDNNKHPDIIREKEIIDANLMINEKVSNRLYSYEMAREICDTVSRSHESIAALCRKFPHWPKDSIIFDWINKKPEFCAMYTRAKRAQIERHIDYIVELSDGDYYDPVKLAQAKIQIDTRKWIAGKLVPSVYGDAQQITVSFEDEQKMKEELKELRAKLDAKNRKEY